MRHLLAFLLLAVPLCAQNPVTPSATPVTEAEMGVAADRAYSSLAAAMTSTTGTITVTDGSAFPDNPFWVTVGPSTECAPGRPSTNCETVYITGKASTNVLTIGATGRQVLASCAGTATGGSNPTHGAGEYVVQTISACQANRWAVEVQDLTEAEYVTHATDCTALTGDRVGQRCHEMDDDANYIWDGAAWDPIAGSAGAPTDATYLTNSANGTLTNEVVINNEATLETAIGGVNLAKVGDNVASATALAANGANCSAGQAAGGVDASGVAETCLDPLTAAEQNAGTDVTADLEEETHASEHSDGGADEIVVTNLASACTDAQVLGGNGLGGVECQSDSGSGGSADFLGDITSPTELTLAAGAVTIAASGSYTLDTELDAATDDFSAPACTAGSSGFLRAANDARTVVLISSTILTPGNVDLALDQDGDVAEFVCPVLNTLVILSFLDENGVDGYVVPVIDGGQALTGTTTRPANTVRMQATRHGDDCRALIDGLDGEVCHQEDIDVKYTCMTGDGLCNTRAEWRADPAYPGNIEIEFPAAPTEVTLASGTATFTATSQWITAEVGSADDWTGATCALGIRFSVRFLVDDITIVNASIPTPTGANIVINEEGDRALVECEVANTPVVIAFYDATTRLYHETEAAGGTETNNLETVTTGIATTEIPIGTAANTAVYAALSGDATMTNAGVVTVSNAGTADALTANGANCAAGNYPLGVDASGAAENCTAASGFFALLGSAKDATATCAGSGAYANLLTFSIAANTLAVGDSFRIDGLTTGTTPTTDTDTQLLMGGVLLADQIAIDTGAAYLASCHVRTLTSISCGVQSYSDANQDNSSNGRYAVADLSANALVIALQYRNCAADSSLTGDHLYAVQAGI